MRGARAGSTGRREPPIVVRTVSTPRPPDDLDATSLQVRRALDGDGAALSWLVTHLDPLLRAQARLRLGRSSGDPDVDDVVAETWTVALRRLGDIEPRGGRFAPSFVAFLSTTSANLCNAHLRRRLRSRATGAETDDAAGRVPDPTRGVVTRLDERDVRGRIEAVLDGMSADKRRVLVLRLLDQRSNAEVAELVGVPANTAAVRYRRALLELRERLPREVYEGLRDLTFGGGG